MEKEGLTAEKEGHTAEKEEDILQKEEDTPQKEENAEEEGPDSLGAAASLEEKGGIWLSARRLKSIECLKTTTIRP